MLIFFSIFVMGLQLGATSCAISCMPVMTPILLSQKDDRKTALSVLFQYFSGKILAYTLISSLSFFGSNIVKNIISPVVPFSKIGAIFIVTLGFFLLYRSFSGNKTCKANCSTSLKYSYFGIGFFSSFSFCLPITSLIAVSSVASSFGLALSYGVVFGFGVAIVPFAFLYFLIFHITSSIFHEISNMRKEIEIFSASLLILIGLLVYFEILKL